MAEALEPGGGAPWLWLEKAPPSVDSRRMPSRTPRAAEPNSEKELRRLERLPASLTGGDGGGGSECRHRCCSACGGRNQTMSRQVAVFWRHRVHKMWMALGLGCCSPSRKHMCR
jgi:hypothetical protein